MSSATISNGSAALHHGFEQRQKRLQTGQLLLVQQDVRVIELGEHLLGVGDKIGRDIAAIELHTLDHIELGLQALGLFDRDHTLIADLVHRLGNHFADFAITIG